MFEIFPIFCPALLPFWPLHQSRNMSANFSILCLLLLLPRFLCILYLDTSWTLAVNIPFPQNSPLSARAKKLFCHEKLLYLFTKSKHKYLWHKGVWQAIKTFLQLDMDILGYSYTKVLIERRWKRNIRKCFLATLKRAASAADSFSSSSISNLHFAPAVNFSASTTKKDDDDD